MPAERTPEQLAERAEKIAARLEEDLFYMRENGFPDALIERASKLRFGDRQKIIKAERARRAGLPSPVRVKTKHLHEVAEDATRSEVVTNWPVRPEYQQHGRPIGGTPRH